ncbi:hypothetical protein KCU79_g16679, partial [Aureobasidium melanogenum]
MSFFKKLKSEFEDMFGDDDKKKEEKPSQPAQGAKPAENKPEQTRDINQPQYSSPAPPDSFAQHQQQSYPPQQQYPLPQQYPSQQQYPLQNQPPYGHPSSSPYGQPGPSPYGQPSPAPYGQHPPPSGPPPPQAGGQLPPGWVQQFDQQSQRFFYVNQATGQTQWEMPQHPVPQNQYSSPPPPTGGAYGGYQPPQAQAQYGQPSPAPYGQGPPPGQYGSAPPQGDQSRGQANSFYDSYGGAMPSVPPQGQHDTRANQYYGDVENKDKDKKKSNGYGSAIAGAAGGLAVGAIGGALLADALGKRSDPH